MLTTQERFYKLCLRLGAKDNPITGRTIDKTYKELVTAYSTSDRYYHNLGHISDGLKDLDEVRHLMKDFDSVEAAWWFHDFIYQPGYYFNEEDSAFAAAKILHELGVKTPIRTRVINRIMATRHDHVPWDVNDRMIIDVDLVSLALPPELFDKNTAKNREEYRIIVPNDKNFEIRRAQFFRKFLEGRPSVYLTTYFHEKYETQAQDNIRRLIAKAGI